MARSRTICVVKRDGTVERFDRFKLRACLLRVLPAGIDGAYGADALSSAIGCYMQHRNVRCTTSAAVFEMALTALRTVHMHEQVQLLEEWHSARQTLRNSLHLEHQPGRRTRWSKQWLVQQARHQWDLGRPAARVLAGLLEKRLMLLAPRVIKRDQALAQLTKLAEAFGLAAPLTIQPVPAPVPQDKVSA